MTTENFQDKAPDEFNIGLPALGDQRTEGDDHLRNIKIVLKTTFANVSGPVTASEQELNYVDITTLGTWQANKALTAASAIDCGSLSMTNINIDSGDIAGVSYAGGTVTGGLVWNAAQDLNNQEFTNANIDSGNIDAAVVLADGIAATTQSPSDNSTALATTAYADAAADAALNSFSGGSGDVYTASGQTIGPDAHGAGGVPDIINCTAECTSTDLGYSVGDRVHLSNSQLDSSGNTIGLAAWGSATQVGAKVGVLGLWTVHKTTGVLTAMSTSSKWKIRVTAIKF